MMAPISNKALVVLLISIFVVSTGLAIWYISLKNGYEPKFTILFEGDPDLFNPYGIIVVNPAVHSHVKLQPAAEFIKWLVSPVGQSQIEAYELLNTQLFTPNANLTTISASEQAFWETISVGMTTETTTVKLATTTSARDSGLLDKILPTFYEVSNIRIDVIALGTGAALDTAREGNVDLVLVHAREKEDEFIAEGFGIHRLDVMYNDFVIIGPDTDPALIFEASSVADAFKKISSTSSKFVSRGDNSGTHSKELVLWSLSSITINSADATWSEDNSWYIESGTGMSATISIAFELEGYTLTDRATWLKISSSSDLIAT
ncbi:MAG: substrate-binding domain-containing protein [Candidatus Kariarchaeaceae archaeon]|jgi:ABC-type tungstate transport system permease subunit